MDKCGKAFKEVKCFLSAPSILARPKENQPLILYLVVSNKAMSLVLVQETEKGEKPIYIVSKVLKGAKLCYQKIERLTLAVVITTQKLRYYFQGHPIILRINYPIKQVLKKSDLEGRMVSWAIKLSKYDIKFVPRSSIKSQILADFLNELSAPILEESSCKWTLSVDGSSNLKGSGARIMIEGPRDLILQYSLCFNFQASNNKAEYKALIARIKLAREVGLTHLLVQTDS